MHALAFRSKQGRIKPKQGKGGTEQKGKTFGGLRLIFWLFGARDNARNRARDVGLQRGQSVCGAREIGGSAILGTPFRF